MLQTAAHFMRLSDL